MKFRSEIGDKLIIARWYEECLVIVSRESWTEILKKLTGKTEIMTKAVRDTDRFILGSAYELELDAQGRFVIPSNLKKYASLSDEVIFLGLGDRVELWDEKIWSEREKAVQEDAAEAIESISLRKSDD